MEYIVYGVIVIVSNILGSISGLGGGTLIKPLLDGFGFHTLVEISFYSTVAVFVMSITSTFKQITNKAKIDWGMAITVSLGSILGGLVGSSLFNLSLSIIGNDNIVNLIQIVIAVFTLIISFLYTIYNWKSINLESKIAYFALGAILGGIASYLGIGGGPLNVFLLMWALNLSMKNATLYSIIVIFFSQFAKLFTVALSKEYLAFDLNLLYVIIPAAIAGGYIGTKISSVVNETTVRNVYRFMIIITLVINIYNAINILY